MRAKDEVQRLVEKSNSGEQSKNDTDIPALESTARNEPDERVESDGVHRVPGDLGEDSRSKTGRTCRTTWHWD